MSTCTIAEIFLNTYTCSKRKNRSSPPSCRLKKLPCLEPDLTSFPIIHLSLCSSHHKLCLLPFIPHLLHLVHTLTSPHSIPLSFILKSPLLRLFYCTLTTSIFIAPILPLPLPSYQPIQSIYTIFNVVIDFYGVAYFT